MLLEHPFLASPSGTKVNKPLTSHGSGLGFFTSVALIYPEGMEVTQTPATDSPL